MTTDLHIQLQSALYRESLLIKEVEGLQAQLSLYKGALSHIKAILPPHIINVRSADVIKIIEDRKL